ncbi:zinc metalloprotease HtpX [Exiguobacterium profundum]|uniref:zinc metalloprotease HtpX n=1 Tax=Exiguobacterium TaxID=33986 RepID=UPI0012F066D3|nr:MULTISPECIES: zinc metalloprotease HtpX [Exiguobacterium]MDX5982410.1 zinc metalloprotease HtpX [Exiguobacterium profundum]VXB91885.1 Protease HtpX homolog [Exiguobacterium sp. 8H]VXC12103.1 Protease HtpX homolog [Exiguobacterium sp. 8A]
MLLYEQIRKNKVKTVFIVTGFVLFVLLVGAAISYVNYGDAVPGLIFTPIFSLFYVGIVIMSSTNIVMKMNRAQEVTSVEEHRFLWHTVENMAMVARVPMPRIFIINDPSPNAFATGLKPEKAAVAVTTGLLDRLSREEIEGVIAHEVAHIKNYDVRLSTVTLALVSVIAIMSDIGSRMLFFRSIGGRRDQNQNPIFLIIGLVLLVLAPLIAMLINMAISRNREFLADASGAELTRNPDALASALEKIANVETPVEQASSASAPLYFSDPLKKKVSGLFSTHPDPVERISRLRQM